MRGTFQRVGAMAIRRHKHDAVLLNDGSVLITGGSDERDSEGVYASAELFDPHTRNFRSGGTLRQARYKHRGTSVLLSNGQVLLAGGAARAELFDPTTKSFSLLGDTTRLAGQFSATAVLTTGQVLISGGYDYLVRFMTRSIQHYQEVVESLLDKNIGISKYFSYIVIKTVFDRGTPSLKSLVSDN